MKWKYRAHMYTYVCRFTFKSQNRINDSSFRGIHAACVAYRTPSEAIAAFKAASDTGVSRARTFHIDEEPAGEILFLARNGLQIEFRGVRKSNLEIAF